jgi:hypothetical protein
MGGTDAHAHLHVGPDGNERLEDGPVCPGDFFSDRAALGRAGKSRRVRGRAGMRPVDGKHAELCEQHDRASRHQNDDGIQRRELSVV